MEASLGLAASIYLADMKIDAVVGDGAVAHEQTVIHNHAYYELFICLSGEAQISYRDKELLMGEGEACIIPPMLYHISRVGKEGGECVGVRFRISRVGGGGSMHRELASRLEAHGAGKIASSEPLSDVLRRVVLEHRGGGEGSREYTDALLKILFLELYRALADNGSSRAEDARVVDEESLRPLVIDEFFYSAIADEVTEEDLARALGLSQRQVSRVLSRIWGKSFRQILIDFRMQRAAELLSYTELPVSEVAAAVGYTSLSGFYSAFGARYGISAAKYRGKFRKNT